MSKQQRRYHHQRTATSVRQASIACHGVLELHPRGYGFLRHLGGNLAREENNVFVSQALIARHGLRPGASVRGLAGTIGGKNHVKGPRLTKVIDVDGHRPDDYSKTNSFDELTARNPDQWLRLGNGSDPSMRILDLFCPIGLGQRALMASPPKAGKTTLLKQIGRSVAQNHPDVHLAVLLVDERPEEVTDMKEEIDAEIFSSNLDDAVANHVRLAQLVVNRCRRQAEVGRDVVLLVDSLTRLARACNKLSNSSSALGPGGLSVRALEIPKSLFSSARQFAEGGSLTIVATVLTETKNRMDDVIFREFKGTGNLDIVLSHQLADRRIWPAIDIHQSGTRRVELLQDPKTLRVVTALRNTMSGIQDAEAMKHLLERLERFQSNDLFIEHVSRGR